MPTADDLLTRAEALEREAAEAMDAGHAQKAARLALQAVALLQAAVGLQNRHQSGTKRGMVPAARTRISAGRSKQHHGEDKAHPLIEAANAQGHTLRSLAEAVKAATGKPCSHAALSRGISGDRPIRKASADAVAKLTGYKATAANWPGGWSPEEG